MHPNHKPFAAVRNGYHLQRFDEQSESAHGYGSSSLTGVTVNVGSAASVTGSVVGLQLGAGNIVNNAGAISGSSAGIAALDNSTIINSGQISATGASGTALSARGTITNTGTISGTSGISALGGASTQITNFGTITATGVGANAVLVGATTAILTITPTSVINGIVLMAGPQDTLQSAPQAAVSPSTVVRCSSLQASPAIGP
jgi:hypothetical protein